MSNKVRVGIIGVGNCAAALVQGVHYYADARPDDFAPGLMHPALGGYHISDIEFSAAFDIDSRKVGKDLGEAILLERSRLESKRVSKTNAVTSQLDYTLPEEDVYIGPSDYVPWLKDRKWAHIRLEGRAFGDVPLNLELKLEVWDSPNSAGVVIDALRCVKIGLDGGLRGTLAGPSAYFMKSPPVQFSDAEARQMVEEFIQE